MTRRPTVGTLLFSKVLNNKGLDVAPCLRNFDEYTRAHRHKCRLQGRGNTILQVIGV